MMATTHALWGMTLALPVVAVAPEFALVALLAGLVGGLAPDFDLYVGHRQTLHYPVYAWVATVPALAVAIFVPTTATVALAVGLAAAGLHAASDAAGGGLELKPWRAGATRAVYSHYHGRWLAARRYVRYDGSPEDLALAGVAGVLLVGATADGPAVGAAPTVVLALLGISSVYTLLRKPLAVAAGRTAELVPRPLRPYVPARYFES